RQGAGRADRGRLAICLVERTASESGQRLGVAAVLLRHKSSSGHGPPCDLLGKGSHGGVFAAGGRQQGLNVRGGPPEEPVAVLLAKWKRLGEQRVGLLPA